MTLINVAGRRAERLRTYQAAAKAVRAVYRKIEDLEADEIVEPLVQAASVGRWKTTMISSIKDQQKGLRALSHDELSQVSEQLESIWHLLPDLGLPRAVPFEKSVSQEAVEKGLRKKGFDPKISRFIFGASSKKMPGIDTGLRAATNWCNASWEGIIRRDSQLCLALAVANFNTAASGNQPTTQSEISKTLSREILENLRKDLRTQDPATAANTAELALIQLSQELSAKAIPAAAKLCRNDFPDAKTATAAVQISSHLRELLWLSATLKLVAWKCTWPQSGEAAALVKAASLPLARKEAATPRVTVGAIAKNACVPGKTVEVLAIVEKVEIRHETKNKPVTTFTLREPGKETRVLATVPGFKADSTGAVAGTAVLLKGSCKAGASGKPGWLQIMREPIMKQSGSSFTDYLKAETYRIYSAVPHALCIQTSWITGIDGPLNPFRYGVTAQRR